MSKSTVIPVVGNLGRDSAMASGKKFVENDLVWAKMKGHPYWPARVSLPIVFDVLLIEIVSCSPLLQIDKPPPGLKSASNKHYVFFFGTLQ